MERPDHISGNWRATVTNVDDPTKSGRVMISIPSLRLTEMWAEPAVAIGGSSGHGSYVIPRVGDKLFVFFDGGNIKHPIYFAMSPGQNDIPVAFNGGQDALITTRNSNALKLPAWNEPTTNASVEYPYGQGIKFPGGTLLVVDESGGETKIAVYHPSNSYNEIESDGTHVSRVSGKDYEIIMGSKFVYIGGSVSETIAGGLGVGVGRDYSMSVGGNSMVSVNGNSTETITGISTENVMGSKVLTVIGPYAVSTSSTLSIMATSLAASFASGGSMTAGPDGLSLYMASVMSFVSAVSMTLQAPLITLRGNMVQIGPTGTVPVLVLGTTFCPYIGAPVNGGSTTVFGSI